MMIFFKPVDKSVKKLSSYLKKTRIKNKGTIDRIFFRFGKCRYF